MFGRCATTALGVIQRNSTTNHPVYSLGEIKWIKRCDEVRSLSSAAVLLSKQKKQEKENKKRDVYYVSPLCAPKGYRYKGPIPSLKCPVKRKTEEKKDGCIYSGPLKEEAKGSPASSQPIPKECGQASPQAKPTGAPSPPPVIGNLPPKPAESSHKHSTSLKDSKCAKKPNIIKEFIAKLKAKKEALQKSKGKGTKKSAKTCDTTKDGSAKPGDNTVKAVPLALSKQVESTDKALFYPFTNSAGTAVIALCTKPENAVSTSYKGVPTTPDIAKPKKTFDKDILRGAVNFGSYASDKQNESGVKSANSTETFEIGPCPEKVKKCDSVENGEKSQLNATANSVKSDKKMKYGKNDLSDKNATSFKNIQPFPSAKPDENFKKPLSAPPGSLSTIDTFETGPIKRIVKQSEAGKKASACADMQDKDTKQSLSTAEKFSPKGHIEALNQAKATESGEKPCDEGKKGCDKLKSVGVLFTPIRLISTSNFDSAPTKQEGGEKKPQGSDTCLGPILECPTGPDNPVFTCPKPLPKLKCRKPVIKFPSRDDTDHPKGEKKPVKVDLGCKTKRSMPNDDQACKPQNSKAFCPDFSKFVHKKCNKNEASPPENPCSVLPWPLNVIYEKVQADKIKKAMCKQEGNKMDKKCKKNKKEKFRKSKKSGKKRKKLIEDKCNEAKKTKKENQIDSQVKFSPCNIQPFPFHTTEPLFKSVLFGGRNVNSVMRFGSKIDCLSPGKDAKDCDVEVTCGKEGEEAMKRLREKARGERFKFHDQGFALGLLPPDGWELSTGAQLPKEKKQPEQDTSTIKCYEQPRFPSRRLRKKVT